MLDIREDILARLVVIAGAVPTIVTADRNNPILDEKELPAAVIFDGDEESDGADDVSMKPPQRPYNVQMTPTIEIGAMSNTVGSDLSSLRRELIKGVLFDTELNNNIVKTGRNGNGAIRYLGCQTDSQWMRSLNGVLRVQFMFKYVLNPSDL